MPKESSGPLRRARRWMNAPGKNKWPVAVYSCCLHDVYHDNDISTAARATTVYMLTGLELKRPSREHVSQQRTVRRGARQPLPQQRF